MGTSGCNKLKKHIFSLGRIQLMLFFLACGFLHICLPATRFVETGL